MAIKKVKLPDNSVVEIHDSRIPGVDSVPTSGSTNIITSGGVYSQLAGKVGSETVDNIVELTKAQYDALATKDPGTLYVVTDEGGTEGFFPIADNLTTDDPDVALSARKGVVIQGEIDSINTLDFTGDCDPWEAGKFIQSVNGSTNTSATYKISPFVDIRDYAGKTLHYQRMIVTVSSVAGLAFYNSSKTYISGRACVNNGAAKSVEEDTIPIPANAAYIRFTFFAVDDYGNFFAEVIGAPLVDRVDALEDAVFGSSGEFTPKECRNRFYLAMTEWCRSHGISGAIIEGPSGYGLGGEVDDEVLTHGQSQLPIYGVAKLALTASAYRIIDKVQAEDFHIIRTRGNEQTITVESRMHHSSYSADLTGSYDVLLMKSGTKSGEALNIAAICDSPSFNGSVVVGVITSTLSADTATTNRYKAMKALMDIASAKLANPSADVSTLEAVLTANSVTQAVAVTLPYGNTELYHGIDLSASRYKVYALNPGTMNPMSIIKLLTAIVTLDYAKDIDQYVTVHQEDITAATGGTGQILADGEQITIRDLIYAMLMESSNSCGYVLARVVGNILLTNYGAEGFLPEEQPQPVETDITSMFSSWTENQFIQYASGSTSSASTLKASGFVDISQYAGMTMRYARLQMTVSSVAGIAFFNASKVYISGKQCIQNAATKTIVDDTVTIPSNATYIRVTAHKDEATYGAFYAFIEQQ